MLDFVLDFWSKISNVLDPPIKSAAQSPAQTPEIRMLPRVTPTQTILNLKETKNKKEKPNVFDFAKGQKKIH